MGMQNIGFIGLGVMGIQMARHLAAAGYGLTVYDINAKALTRLQSLHTGVNIASSPKAVAAVSEIVMTMLPTGQEVYDTVFGTDGLLQGFKSGSLLIDTSSSEPWRTQSIAARLGEANVEMVDAPVSGAEAGAMEATLVFMVGGKAESVGRIKPLLSVLGKKIFYLGPIGSGHAMKSINNLITAATFLATAEGLVVGKGYGLDPAVMNQVLNDSTGMSWISRNHIAQRILSRRFDDPFKLDLMVKDINIAVKLAKDLGLELPLSIMTQALWQETQTRIAPGSSVSELVRALETQTGIELSVAAGRETSEYQGNQ
jgi:3-hydroxyisobutyrate dehydrogenase